MRRVQLVRSGTAFACILRNESAVLVVFHDAGVDVAVGDEDVSLRVPRHVGRPSEFIFLIEPRTFRRVCLGCTRHRLRPPAEHHDDTSLRVELDHHVRPLIDDPDVVLRIDAHLVRELEAIDTDSPFLHKVPVRVELEKPGVSAPVIHEHVSLRVGRDADAFAEVKIRRELEEIRH